MARPKEFDKQATLSKAVDAFWERGFVGTSVQQLVDTMGIHRASLYDTYGSKQELFREAMDLYSRRVQALAERALDRPGPSSRVLDEFFMDTVRELCAPDTKGCLMVRTVFSGMDDVPGARERVVKHMQETRRLFHDVLRRGQVAGEVGAGANLEDLSDFLVTLYEGVVVNAAIERDARRLERTVRAALAVLA
jgi:TetR/AcrR family transcriptional repressor of nem operon